MNSLTSAAASFIRSADEGLRDRVSIYTSCSLWFVTFGLLLTLSNIHRFVGFCRVFIDPDFLCVLWVLFASLPVFSSVFVTIPLIFVALPAAHLLHLAPPSLLKV